MKILIIDNHTLFRDGLRFLLQRSPRGFDEIFEADSFYSGLYLVQQNQDIDMVLLEIKSPGCGGLISVEKFHKLYPDIPLVVVSSEEYGAVVNDALSKGASGYVCKSSTSSILLSALMYVIAGGIFIPPQMIEHTRITFNTDIPNNGSNPCPVSARLTSRQMQVMCHIAEGLSSREIASAMCIAEGTVKVHTAAIFQELRVNNRVQAKIVAESLGLLTNKKAFTPVHALTDTHVVVDMQMT
jgi:DNA-binding NarL/FixJ family response regulator